MITPEQGPVILLIADVLLSTDESYCVLIRKMTTDNLEIMGFALRKQQIAPIGITLN
jgi:hypothetical protein